MTNTRDGQSADYRPRAADSAACLLVVGGYEEYADILRRVVAGVRQRILMSPTLGDFFQVRFCDLGPRPSRPSRGTAEVARMVLELTSRPADAGRNFSAVLVFDQSARVVDQLLEACARDPAVNQLNARCLGMASRDDRAGRASGGGPARLGGDIAIARHGRRSVEEFVTEIYGLAERLLSDFGSGRKLSVRPEEVSRLGSVVEPAARGVIAKASADEDARLTQRQAGRRDDESAAAGRRETERREAERKQQAAREAAAWNRELAAQRAEAELQAEAERLAVAKRQIAELEAEVAALKRGQERAAPPPGEGQETPAATVLETPDPRRVPELEQPRGARPASGDPSVTRDTNPVAAPEQEGGDTPADRAGGRWQRIREIGGVAGRELASRVRSPQASAAPGAGSAVDLLSECGERLRAQDLAGIQERLPALRRYAGSEISPTDRELHRVVMIDDQLLSPRLPPGPPAVEFYDILLRLAYGQPLGYQQYCDLEDCLQRAGEGALPPVPALIRAIDAAYPVDPFVLAITRYHSSRYQREERARPRPGDIRRLIIALGEVPFHQRHVDILFGILTRYLGDVRTSSERREITGLLRDRGYLSAALNRNCPDAVPDQVVKLVTLLRWAYPDGLDRAAAEAVIGAGTASTALLPALLQAMARSSDRPWIIREFLHQYQGRDITADRAAELEPDIMRLALGAGVRAGEITAGS